MTGTVPVNKELLTGTVPVNNLFQILMSKRKVTVSEEILDILRRADRLLGVPSIRSELIDRGRKDSPAFRKQVVRVLKVLEEQGRSDFKRLKCSYYGGDESKVVVIIRPGNIITLS